MSGRATSLPPEVKELMTQTVIWEPAGATDGYGQQSFGPPQTLSCWIEARSLSTGGFDADRGATDWVFLPTFQLLFDGDNPYARSFTLNDRFTIAYNGGAMVVQPSEINPWFGPNFDNKNPWLISVVAAE